MAGGNVDRAITKGRYGDAAAGRWKMHLCSPQVVRLTLECDLLAIEQPTEDLGRLAELLGGAAPRTTVPVSYDRVAGGPERNVDRATRQFRDRADPHRDHQWITDPDCQRTDRDAYSLGGIRHGEGQREHVVGVCLAEPDFVVSVPLRDR
jgi:hypothetical protein